MTQKYILVQFFFIISVLFAQSTCNGQSTDTISVRHKVTLPEAHIGNLEIDTKLLNSYGLLPENIKQFYLDTRLVFSENRTADFTNAEILKSAQKHNLALIGGPMLGDLKDDRVTLWLRPSTSEKVVVNVFALDGNEVQSYWKNSNTPGEALRLVLYGLLSDTKYNYVVSVQNREIASGKFTTAPSTMQKGIFKLAFGSCFHKIGLQNPNLMNQILKRKPHAIAFLGDIAVDDRENRINMHRSDYLLRDVSNTWKNLSANVPIYASWDDHDYLNNDLSGIPKRFTQADVEELRAVWHQNWNNPKNAVEGIYFNTRIGPVELIMLDTRSCRKVEERGQYGSYLGLEQQRWLMDILKTSTAPFKVISSGTMWSDDISNGKDSWGTWDTLAREEIFKLIETENISGVLLISGDRHGARGFTIPRPSGYALHEFECACLGGVPGPAAYSKDPTNQLFGYHGTDVIAFGEFTFNTLGDKPNVTFRLIEEFGNILEEHLLQYRSLSPMKATK